MKEFSESFMRQAFAGIAVAIGVVFAILALCIFLLMSIELAIAQDEEYESFNYESEALPAIIISQMGRVLDDIEEAADPNLKKYRCEKKNRKLAFYLEKIDAKLVLHPEWADIYAPTIAAIHSSWCHDHD